MAKSLVLVLGDQLNRDSTAFDGFDPAHDAVWMSETPHETTHVWCHKLRIAFFLSAMRHFRDALIDEGITVHYQAMASRPAEDRGRTFAERLTLAVMSIRADRALRPHSQVPQRLIVVQPGDWRVEQELRACAAALGVELEVRRDSTFLCDIAEFNAYADERQGLLLENFYRWMRKRHRILIDAAGEPVGGRWNYDHDNRRSFGRRGPTFLAPPLEPAIDATTRQVFELVNQRFAEHPGSLDHFALPVTRQLALAQLDDFIEHRLADFGAVQDAMWSDEPFLYHSRLSAALNVKLICAREVLAAVLKAAKERRLPINSVEGFIRQLLGWREFVRGVYWRLMPEYAGRNTFGAQEALPQFYWTGATGMRCMQQCTGQLLRHAYAHHIQRLMVFGNFALLWGADPIAFHEWHMAMYVDAVDWVSLPNAFGMSQHADEGVIGTKPYIASGAYINRMSNYCRDCRYDPRAASGEDACPFTTLYWDFLERHRAPLERNPRMRYPLLALERKTASERTQLHRRAAELHERDSF